MKPIINFKFILLLLSFGILSAASINAQQPKTLKSSGYAPVNGLKLYYEVHGEGQPILLLHGAYMTIGLNWNQLLPELSKTRKVIVVEMQGHGHTADTERPFAYPTLASDVAGLLKHLKVDSADILGYSFGGTIALQVAIQYPQLVKKLVIISTAFRYDGWLPEVRSMLESFKPEFLDQTPLKAIYDSIAPDPKHWHPFVNKFVQFDTKDYNLGEDKIKAIKSPALLIMGDNDGVDLQHKTNFYKLLGGNTFGDIAGVPKSRLAIVPGATHVGVMMEGDKLLSYINPFLSGK